MFVIPAKRESVPAIIRFAEKPALAEIHPQSIPAIGLLPTPKNAIAARGGTKTEQVSEARLPHVPIKAIRYGITEAGTPLIDFFNKLSTRPTCSQRLMPNVIVKTRPSEAKPEKFEVIVVKIHVKPSFEKKLFICTSSFVDGLITATFLIKNDKIATIKNNPINIINGLGNLFTAFSMPPINL